jgi:hypothetical protein
VRLCGGVGCVWGVGEIEGWDVCGGGCVGGV